MLEFIIPVIQKTAAAGLTILSFFAIFLQNITVNTYLYNHLNSGALPHCTIP